MRKMTACVLLAVMSSAFFSPSIAFSSHFDTGGAPLSELSWPSSLAVVAVSFSGLFTFVFLMLACLCCKKGDINFKEFENPDGEESRADVLTSPGSQNGPEVYILPLTEVSLPVSKQPGRSIQFLKSADLGRHSLLYLKEIGHGWFGKVLLGEVNAGLSSSQVVVKELKASASVQDQMHFLEEAKPYRTLQHPALLQCLAQCTEVTPYLLVMEFCPLGDVKGYLRSCRVSDTVTPDPLILQRLACEIASGLLHLHKHNFIHSDLALRNCLLTSELSVKIGDYGLSHNRYRDDYFVTADQLWVPLRWIAPELIDEVHGNLLVVDQTKASNVWSLGVTIWELFELGNQPYRHYSDRQVLTYAVKEQQLKLPKPLLKVPLAERWYEVMQFCWLQPEQRPVAEEVHLLLSYLCAKGLSEAEEDFEKRWNSLRPGMGGPSGGGTGVTNDIGEGSGGSSGASAVAAAGDLASSVSSSFPLLEQFSRADSFHTEAGDDILTVTETSHGLNFEYKWQQARAEQPYCSSSTTGKLGQSNPHYQDIYYPLDNTSTTTAPDGSGCSMAEGLTLGVSPSYYESEHLGVVPVLSAHSPSDGSEYYIRIEEPMECAIRLEDTNIDYSPGMESSHSHSSGHTRQGGRGQQAAEAEPNTYWSAAKACHPSAYDSDASPDISLSMESLQRRASGASAGEKPQRAGHYFSPNDRRGSSPFHCEQLHSPRELEARHRAPSERRFIDEDDEDEEEESSWRLPHRGPRLGAHDTPMGISLSLSSPSLGCCDPYLEANQAASGDRNTPHEGYYDMTGSLQKSLSRPHYLSIDVEAGDRVLVGLGSANDPEEDDDLFMESETTNWTSNQSANNNSFTFDSRQAGAFQDVYFDLQHTAMPSSMIKNAWCEKEVQGPSTSTSTFKPVSYLEATGADSLSASATQTHSSSAECGTYIHLCQNGEQETQSPVPVCSSMNCLQAPGQLKQPPEKLGICKKISDNVTPKPALEEGVYPSGERSQSIFQDVVDVPQPSLGLQGIHSDIAPQDDDQLEREMGSLWAPDPCSTRLPRTNKGLSLGKNLSPHPEILSEHSGRGMDASVKLDCSSISLIDVYDCSDDDLADVTNTGVFADSPLGFADDGADVGLVHGRPLLRPVKAPPVGEGINLASSCSPSESFNLHVYHTSVQPKSHDSGYDTENNESPEFIPKDLELKPALSVSLESDEQSDMGLQLDLEECIEEALLTPSGSGDLQLCSPNEKNPYRDSAYFSDYDTENDRSPSNGVSGFFSGHEDEDIVRHRAEKKDFDLERRRSHCFASVKDGRDASQSDRDAGEKPDPSSSPFAFPVALDVLAPFPPQMGGCLTKESVPEDGIGLETEQSVDEASSSASSDCCTSTPMEGSSASQEAAPTLDEKADEEHTPNTSLGSGSDSASTSTLAEFQEERSQERQGSTDELLEEKQLVLQLDMTEIRDVDDTDGEDSPSNGDGVYNSGLTAELASPDLGLDDVLRAPLGDGEDADEEDSDDSESDEELRSYNVQEQSEESDEDFSAVPVVVSERSSGRHLRSLLKMPSLLTQSFCDELEHKKKAVSFFDDVTVFLFDQESPTGELADFSFPPETTPSSDVQPSNLLEVNTTEITNENNANGGLSGGFEWEDDFPLMPSPPSPSLEPSAVAMALPPSPPPKMVEERPAPSRSRFSVSRFSITHVSDSDMDSVGGFSEDGAQE